MSVAATAQPADSRRRGLVCWGIIAGSWIVTKLALLSIEGPNLDLPAPKQAMPPAWTVAVACVGAALLLFAVVSRRGRACMRMRPRLSQPSAHGDTYIEAFALEALLVAATVASMCWINWRSELPFVVFSWLGYFYWLIAIAYVLARVRSFRTPLKEWGWQRGRGVCREISIGILAALLIWLTRLVPRAVAAPDAVSLLYPDITLRVVVFAPMLEETLYRGALYRYMRDRLPWLPTVVFSSAVFALMHDSSRMPYVYVGGLVFGLLREWRRSLVAPIAAHASGNLLSTAAAGLLVDVD